MVHTFGATPIASGQSPNLSRTVTPVSASAFRKALKLEGGSVMVAIKKPGIATMYLNASILFLVTAKLGLPPVYALTLPA